MVTGGQFWDPSLYKATANYAWLGNNKLVNDSFSFFIFLTFLPQLKLAESSSSGLAACPGTMFGKHGMYMDATGVVYVVSRITLAVANLSVNLIKFRAFSLSLPGIETIFS
jgi:hypothetical protein